MVCLINGKGLKWFSFFGGGVHKKKDILCVFLLRREQNIYTINKKLYRTLFCLNQENLKLKKINKKTPPPKKTPQIKGDKK